MTMRPDLPASHVEESMKLEVRAVVLLYEIQLRQPNGSNLTLNICPQKEVTWQGTVWHNDTPCALSERSYSADGSVSRPKFSIANPDAVWSRYVHQKYTDNAIVKEYEILRPHLDDDLNIYTLSSWRISKILSLTKELVVAELRTLLDGQIFKIPSDTYRPPKYPTVSVQ